MSLESITDRELGHALDLRHRLHQIPELGYEEVETARVIRAELDRLGIGHIDGVANAPTATIGLIGDPDKPCIALRADIDALPIAEKTGLPYASQRPGRMHACGHDGHMATLLATAAVLKRREATLDCCVKLLFQPAEEGGGGGERLCDAGVLDGRVGPKVKAIYGLHGWPGLPVGSVSTRAGALLAATDTFTATFRGKGCHGAYPHLGSDPIPVVCDAVLGLQRVVSRGIDPTEPAVVTVGTINAGTATNIIPETATIAGTVRSLTANTRQRLEVLIRRHCQGAAAAGGCELLFDWEPGYPATVNDPRMADHVSGVARAVLGADRFVPAAGPSMGGEDFAYYLERVPGCFFLLGLGGDATSSPPLHSDRFDFNDEALATGVRMFCELIMRFGDLAL